MKINLPNYARTNDTRYWKAHIHWKEGERACEKVLYPGKIEYCPVQGRDREGEPPSRFEKVSLLLDADPEAWKIDVASVNRKQELGEEEGGNRVDCIIKGNIKGIDFTIDTQLFNVDIGPGYYNVAELYEKPVDPVIRVLDPNPKSIKYYGVCVAQFPYSRKPKPFTDKLIDFGKPGIASIGITIPKYRCKAEELVKPFKKDPDYLIKGLGVESVSVPDYKETSGTLGIQAAYEVLRVLPPEIRKTVGAVFVGTESPDHKVKGIGTIIQDILGLGEEAPGTNGRVKLDCTSITGEFACVPAWMYLKDAYSRIIAGDCKSVLIVGTDVAAGAPGHALDWDTGAMGSAILVSTYNHILTPLYNDDFNPVQAISTATSDEADFQNDDRYPDRLIGAYSLEPFRELQTIACKRTLEKLGLTAKDFKVVAPHTPNWTSSYRLMTELGFDEKNTRYVLDMVKYIGNCYSAAVTGNLRRGIELMKPGDKSFVSAYGSTAGAVAAGFEATYLLPKFLEAVVPTQELLFKDTEYAPYITRAFRKDMIIKN